MFEPEKRSIKTKFDVITLNVLILWKASANPTMLHVVAVSFTLSVSVIFEVVLMNCLTESVLKKGAEFDKPPKAIGCLP